MPHPKDNEAYPPGTVVRVKKTNEFAIIKSLTFQFNEQNYVAVIEGRGDHHDDIELEHLPPPTQQSH